MRVHPLGSSTRGSYLGRRAYSVTCRTADGRRCLTHAATGLPARAQLVQLARDERFALLAYCFMPDHVRLLVEGTSTASDLPRLIARWKQRTELLTSARLWQAGFSDRVLGPDEDRVVAARHILATPVRDGLVASLLDYPYWGSAAWSRAEIVNTLFEGGRSLQARAPRDPALS
jgi:putative transposase